MANLITLSRLILLAGIVTIIYTLPPEWQLLSLILLIVTFVTDGLDGYVARKHDESSQFGAMFDIATDRIVEWTMWIVLVDLALVPVWVLITFVVRGILVDAIRSTQAAEHRRSPFSMMQSRIGRWLVAGKFMRIFYAVWKAVTFCWLLLTISLPAVLPGVWQQWSAELTWISGALIFSTVLICVARGIPVIWEFVYAERRSLLGSLARKPHEQNAEVR